MDGNHSHYYILGLDLGIASIGFALIDTIAGDILEMGSHLFDIPWEPKSRASLAATRRSARSVRRNTKRRRDRQKHCLKILAVHGIVPEGVDKEWLHSAKGDKPVLELRVKGLDEPLTNRELAQVLYNLSARRGYIPHGEGKSGADKDTKVVLSAIDSNIKKMQELGLRTVGELLLSDGQSRNRAGKYERCVLHSQIVDEAQKILSAQRALGNQSVTVALEDEYLACLSWQKTSADHDRRVYEGQVGFCVYFPSERRAARADLSSELCNAYERLCHIRVVDNQGNEIKLPKDLVVAYIGTLFSPTPLKGNKNCKVTYTKIRKDLDLSGKCYFKGVDSGDEAKEPYEPRSWRAMRASLSRDLLGQMLRNRALADGIGEALTFASSEESLLAELERLDLSDDEKAEIASLPFNGKNFKGYANRSVKALGMLLDAFEEPDIQTLAQAEEAAGLKALRMGDKLDRSTLLAPYDAYDPTCKNPVVLRALSRARKVINAIIRIHGVPDEIHVEVGTDLKRSKRERDQISKRQRENKKRNERLSGLAAEILGIDPSEVRGKLVTKMALYEEQSGIDLYTGESISLERLVREDHYCQIDHILPYGRTCEDGMANKVLVLAKSNQDKGDRTPYEWMTSEDSNVSWEQFHDRILASPKVSHKRRFLLNTNLGEEEQASFIDRNLNDTRYMSRSIKAWLEDTLEFPDNGRKVHVLAVAGGATATLRRKWALNFGAGNTKDRDDARHHAVDAAVIAACSARSIQLVARASSASNKLTKEKNESRLADTQPWPTFATDVIARREHVVPTRMVSHKVTGRAFEDMAYGYDGIDECRKGSYSLLHRSGKTIREGNVVIDKAGSARIVDGMAFLRLWLNPEERHTRGGGIGVWHAEPVYYADLPAIMSGNHKPKSIKNETARTAWQDVPAVALKSAPLILFPNAVLVVDGHIARYTGIHIGNKHLYLSSVMPGDSIKRFPSIGSWTKDTHVEVLEEDCLGHCYQKWLEHHTSEN